MRWFRSNLCFGSCCAIFALAVQLALSFAHVHADRLVIGSVASLLYDLGDQLRDVSSRVPDTPSKQAVFVDYCAICTNIQFAHSVLPTQPPSSLSPTIPRGERIRNPVEFELIAWSRAGFQA